MKTIIRYGWLLIVLCGLMAVPEFLQGQQLLTPSERLLLQRASAAYEEERYIEVIGMMEGFLETPVENADSWLLLAGSHLALNDVQAAGETLDRALSLMPDHPRLLQGRADVHLGREEYAEALQIFHKLHRLAREEGAPAEETDQIKQRIAALNMHLGGVAVQQNRLNEAGVRFSEALKHQPDSLYSYTNLAFVKIENNDPEGALEIVDKGLRQFPGHADLQKMKASILSNLEDAEALEGVLADLVTLEPDNLDLAGNYLTMLLYNQNFEKAGQFVENVLGDQSLGPGRYMVLAGAYENAGYTTGQIGVLQRYLEEYPGDTDVEVEVAGLLVAVNETEQAKSTYRKLAQAGDAEAGQELALLYAAEDSLDTALDIYQKLAEQHSTDVDVLWGYAVLLNRMNRPGDAITLLEGILEVNDDSRFVYERVLAGDRAGETEHALEMYEKLAKQGFYHPAMFLRLAEEGRSIPGLGEGCGMVQSLFSLVLRQSMLEQEGLLSALQQENAMAAAAELNNRPEPAETDLNELDDISRSVLNEVMERCNPGAAKEFIEGLLQQYNSSASMYLMASGFYDEQNQPGRALVLAEKAAAFSPNLAEAHLVLARLLEEQKKTEQARLAYERVLVLDDRYEEAYTALLQIYRNTNRLDELCDRWLIRYRTNRENEMLYKYLHEALLRAGRWDDARDLQQQE